MSQIKVEFFTFTQSSESIPLYGVGCVASVRTQWPSVPRHQGAMMHPIASIGPNSSSLLGMLRIAYTPVAEAVDCPPNNWSLGQLSMAEMYG